MRKRLLAISLMLCVGLYLYSKGKRRTEEAAEKRQIITLLVLPARRRAKWNAWLLAALVAVVLLVGVGYGLNRPVLPEIKPTSEAALQEPICAFPACEYNVIVTAIKVAQAKGEAVPCTYEARGNTEVPTNTEDLACHKWLWGE